MLHNHLRSVEREEQKIRLERKEDAQGSSILDGFLNFEGLTQIANQFMIQSNQRLAYRNRFLALMSFALCTRLQLLRACTVHVWLLVRLNAGCRSDNSTQFRLSDFSLLPLKAFDGRTDLQVLLVEIVLRNLLPCPHFASEPRKNESGWRV